RNFPGVVPHKIRSKASTNIQPVQTAIKNTVCGSRTFVRIIASTAMTKDDARSTSRTLAKNLRKGWPGSKGFDTPPNKDSEVRQKINRSIISFILPSNSKIEYDLEEAPNDRSMACFVWLRDFAIRECRFGAGRPFREHSGRLGVRAGSPPARRTIQRKRV